MNLKDSARKLKREIPAAFLALKDRETPFAAKVMAAVTVAYALSPIDFIPDFIPILGYLDDVILLPALIFLTIKLIPHNVWMRCVSSSNQLWTEEKLKKWYFAIPVVLIWILVILLVVKAVCF